MARALYVRPNDVFKNTFINGDLDPDKMIPFIEAAQDVEIQNLLGKTLYDRIDQLIYDARVGPSTENGNIDQPEFANYKDLIQNYIKPITEQYAACYWLRYGGYTASNQGLFRYEASNSTAATDDERWRLIRSIEERAEFYAERMYDYICQNSQNWPEWGSTALNDLPPSHQQYDYGFLSL